MTKEREKSAVFSGRGQELRHGDRLGCFLVYMRRSAEESTQHVPVTQ